MFRAYAAIHTDRIDRALLQCIIQRLDAFSLVAHTIFVDRKTDENERLGRFLMDMVVDCFDPV